ncbi:unnamed protein product [Protopolystoma xenopodis]|uniref:Uncharacterized protein n=1 Tax=Protopolystoma xenopodis TaxID=117903 RepID=A0A448XKR5_9PLAT|nr:unnamed protein product [Protopolystoma xenopodis]
MTLEPAILHALSHYLVFTPTASLPTESQSGPVNQANSIAFLLRPDVARLESLSSQARPRGRRADSFASPTEATHPERMNHLLTSFGRRLLFEFRLTGHRLFARMLGLASLFSQLVQPSCETDGAIGQSAEDTGRAGFPSSGDERGASHSWKTGPVEWMLDTWRTVSWSLFCFFFSSCPFITRCQSHNSTFLGSFKATH